MRLLRKPATLVDQVRPGAVFWQNTLAAEQELIINYFGHCKRYCIIYIRGLAAEQVFANPGSGENDN